MRIFYKFSRSVVVVAVCLAHAITTASNASAAELRFTYAELASIVQSVMTDAELNLDNKPSGLFNTSSGSSFSVAGKTIEFPLPPKSFQVLGSTYAYYVDNLASEAITVAAVPSAVRVTLTFPKAPFVLSAGCISGDCGFQNALPKITWKNGSVAIDVVPIRSGASLALDVRAVSIGGPIAARCDATGLFSSSGCNIALSYANRTIARLKPDIAAKLKDKINAPETRASISAALKKYLTLGKTGDLSVTNVSTDATAVRIQFAFAPPAGG